MDGNKGYLSAYSHQYTKDRLQLLFRQIGTYIEDPVSARNRSFPPSGQYFRERPKVRVQASLASNYIVAIQSRLW